MAMCTKPPVMYLSTRLSACEVCFTLKFNAISPDSVLALRLGTISMGGMEG